MRFGTLIGVSMSALLLVGCSARSGNPRAAGAAEPERTARLTTARELPGVSSSYRAAVQPHAQTMRKPLRDARARALRALARNATALRQEAAGWDYEERLVGADGAVPSSASRQAVEEFQAALADLGAAAAAQDLARTRMAYARTRSAYERVHALTTPAPAPTQ